MHRIKNDKNLLTPCAGVFFGVIGIDDFDATWKFRVRAIDEYGTSEWSEVLYMNGTDAPAGKVRNLQWTDNGDQRTFTWDSPVGYDQPFDPPRNPIQYYTWQWFSDCYDGFWTDVGGSGGPYQFSKNADGGGGTLTLTASSQSVADYCQDDWADPLTYTGNEVAGTMQTGTPLITNCGATPPTSSERMRIQITAYNGIVTGQDFSTCIWFYVPFVEGDWRCDFYDPWEWESLAEQETACG